VLPALRGAGIGYYPFAGTIAGHPSRLFRSPEEIITSAKLLTDMEGVDGLDLRAYRFVGDAPGAYRKGVPPRRAEASHCGRQH